MGSKCSPSYACIFMGFIEQKCQAIGGNKILLWKRYIDDIVLIWKGSKTELEQYMEEINYIHGTIKFTHECSENELNFLDTTIYKGSRYTEQGILDIRTHIKKTNKQLYVHATSYPKGCKKGIVIGEAKRYLRTNSNKQNFETSIHKHKAQLASRGYQRTSTNELLTNIHFSDRDTNLKTIKPKLNEDILTFVSTYNDCTPQLRSVLYDNWNILLRDNTLKEIFPMPPIMSLRKNPSLNNKLVRANPMPLPELQTECLSQTIEAPRGNPIAVGECNISKCNRRTCKLCPMLKTENTVKSTLHRRKHRIYGQFSCQTKNIVYLLQCKKCGKQYVGQTVLSFSHRVAKHILTINKNGTDKLSLHFNNDGHSVRHLSFQPITKVNTDLPIRQAEKKLQEIESVWINRLGSLQPVGLNYILHDKQSRVRNV